MKTVYSAVAKIYIFQYSARFLHRTSIVYHSKGKRSNVLDSLIDSAREAGWPIRSLKAVGGIPSGLKMFQRGWAEELDKPIERPGGCVGGENAAA